VMFRQDRSQD